MSKSKSLGMLAVVALAAMLFTAVAVGPAFAGKKGNGGNGTEVIAVSPDPVHVGDGSAPATFTISGSGFRASREVRVSVVGKLEGLHTLITDSSGTFATTFTLDLCSGCWYYVEAYEYRGSNKVVLAWLQFQTAP